VGDLRRLIVFDLDGTLVDSRRDLADAANALIAERGGRMLPEEDIGRMVGEGAAVLVRRALAAAGLPPEADSVARFLELYDERLLQTTVPYPGIPQVLDTLRAQAAIAVLTNKPLAPSRRILDALGLSPAMSMVIGGDGEFPKKPDPASLRHLMNAAGATPEATVMVGDSRIDFETARHAGTRVCLARYGFGFEGFPLDELRGGEEIVSAADQIPNSVGRLFGVG
jgi:phosphoglycolate phosphatase